MSARSNLISKLQSSFDARAAYIQAKVTTLVPAQIRGLRLKSDVPTQPDLAVAAKMKQSRISTLETAGTNPTLGTLSSIAAALGVGLKVEFVPFSEMLDWENRFSQDKFKVTKLDDDIAFLNPSASQVAVYHWNPSPAPLYRHSGTYYTSNAIGDFSTVWGGNVVAQSGVINISPNDVPIPEIPVGVPALQHMVPVNSF